MVTFFTRSFLIHLATLTRSIILGLCAFLASSQAQASPPVAELEIAIVNGVYTQLDPGLVPVKQGPVTLLISSPEHELKVHSNKLTLSSLPGGLVAASFEAEVEGWGQLIVEIQTVAGNSTMSDRVEAGRQWLEAAGTVRLERAEAGYLATFVEFAQESVGVQVESQLVDQVVEACRGMVALGFAVLDCDSLSASMRLVQVPLPDSGEQFLIRQEYLTVHEREVFDRFVGAGS